MLSPALPVPGNDETILALSNISPNHFVPT
jgi:hypothetical protein